MQKIPVIFQVLYNFLDVKANLTDMHKRDGAKSQYILTDFKYNDLKLLFNVPVRQFFVNEDCNYKIFYLKRKHTNQKNLLTLQEESVGVDEAQKSSESEETTKAFKNFLDNDVMRYFPGLKSYLEPKKYEAIYIETHFVNGNFQFYL